MSILNVEYGHDSFPQHLCMGTEGTKLSEDLNEHENNLELVTDK